MSISDESKEKVNDYSEYKKFIGKTKKFINLKWLTYDEIYDNFIEEDQTWINCVYSSIKLLDIGKNDYKTNKIKNIDMVDTFSSVLQENSDYDNIFCQCILTNNLKMMKRLNEMGCEINSDGENAAMVYKCVIIYKQPKFLEYLESIKVTHSDYTVEKIWMMAICEDSAEILKYIEGKNPGYHTIFDDKKCISDKSFSAYNSYHYAAHSGSIKVMDYLESIGMDIYFSSREIDGATAYLFACWAHNVTSLKYLKNKGFDIHIEKGCGDSYDWVKKSENPRKSYALKYLKQLHIEEAKKGELRSVKFLKKHYEDELTDIYDKITVDEDLPEEIIKYDPYIEIAYWKNIVKHKNEKIEEFNMQPGGDEFKKIEKEFQSG